jgi:hypothetical protein
MSAALIAQLIITLGPTALGLINDLVKVWNKPELSLEEIKTIVDKAQKSYDEYIAEAKATTVSLLTPTVKSSS